MKKIFVIIYSVFISLIFAGAIGYFGYGLYSEFEHGELRTQRRIDSLVQKISNIPDNIVPGTVDFRDQMLLSIENLNDFSSLRIQKKNSILFNYPENYSISKDTKQSHLIKTYEKNITNNKNIYIQASLYVLRPATIFKYARLSFLIILAGTILTIIILIFNNLIKNNTSITQNVNFDDSNKEDSSDEQFIEENTNDKPESVIIDSIEQSTSLETKLTSNTTDNDTTIFKNNIMDEENSILENQYSETKTIDETSTVNYLENINITKETITEDTIVSEKVDLPQANDAPFDFLSEPTGLFSPVTGFGWQNYLETRLTNELNRATASEIDLSLFIIKIPALLNCSDLVLSNICKTITNLFQFQDLIFEYSDDCFAAMKISMTVDEAIIFGDKVINELSKVLPEDQKESYIGISSRSIRMVEARTILHESQAALNHAYENKNPPVIAFRADTAKYRRYMELD